MADVQNAFQHIRQLSQEKEAITESLERENNILRGQMAQLTTEKEAIAEFCLAEDIKDSFGEIPKQPVQYLIQERSQFLKKIGKSDEEKIELTGELETIKKELQKVEDEKSILEKQVIIITSI